MMVFGSFCLQWLAGILAIAVAVYIPGRLFGRALQLQLSTLEELTLGLVSGAAWLVLIYWTLSQLGWQSGLWVYVLVCLGLEIYFSIQDMIRQQKGYYEAEDAVPESLSIYWPLGLLILAGMLAQARYTAFTGWLTPQGMSLLAWHGHDAPWHIFNVAQLARQFPPEMPGFAGETLKNYHMFSDLLWGALLRLAPIDPWHVYFRIAPLFYSAVMSLSIFVAARQWAGNLRTAYLATALNLFCSNFGYIFPLLFGVDRYFIWESILWIQPPLTNIFNPGVSSSFALVMTGFWALVKWFRRQNWRYLIVLAVVWGVLPGFKVYPGLLVMASLLVVGIFWAVVRRSGKVITPFLLTLPVFLYVFLPSNWNAPSLVRFLPGYNLGAMLVAPDRMALMSAASLKQLYVSNPGWVVLLMAGLALLFLIGNLGVRAIGLVPLLRSLRRFPNADPSLLFMGCLVAGATLIPILFVQSGVQWNTIQFFYYAVLICSLPAARQFWNWVDPLPKKYQRVWLAVFFLLGLPGTIQSMFAVEFYAQINPRVVAGLSWLKAHAQPDEVILRPLPKDYRVSSGWAQWQRNQVRGRMTSFAVWTKEAQALAAASTTATANTLAAPAGTIPVALAETVAPAAVTKTTQPLSAKKAWPAWEEQDVTMAASLTERNSFLEDTVSSQIMGLPVEARMEAVRKFYESANVIEAREFLEKNRIGYIIVYPGMELPFDPEGIPLKLQFSNEGIRIYHRIRQLPW